CRARRGCWLRDDTNLGVDGGLFPKTQHSIVEDLRAGDPQLRARAMERLFSAYSKPIYMVMRRRWYKSQDDAEDLVQEFFNQILHPSGPLAIWDPQRGRLRTWIQHLLRCFISNDHRARMKDALHASLALPFDIDQADRELRSGSLSDSQSDDWEVELNRQLAI